MGSAQKAISGIVWSVVVNVVNACYGFLAVPLLISYFGRSEYGLISLAMSVNAYMGLLDMGLSSTNVRFFSNWLVKGDEQRIIKLMQTCNAFYGIIGIVNGIILFFVSFFSSEIFNVTAYQDAILKQMLWILSITAVVNWYTSCFGQMINATENVAWVQKRTLLTKFLLIGAVASVYILKLTIIQYFVLTLLASLALIPLTIRKVKKEAPYIRFNAKFDRVIFKEILPYSISIFSFSIFQFSFLNLRTIILGMRGSIEAVTDYGVMHGITGLVTMIGGVFINALLPSSSRVVANDDKVRYDKLAYQGTHFITVILGFCSFGLMSISRDLIIVYVGNDFIHLTPWLNLWLILLLYTHNSCISSLILGGSDIKLLTYSCGLSAFVGIIVGWIAVPYLGAGGTVVSLGAYYLVQLLFNYFYYWPNKLGINSMRIFKDSLFPVLFIGLSLNALLNYIPHTNNHWLNILLIGCLFAITYSIFVCITMNKEYRRDAGVLIKSFVRK